MKFFKQKKAGMPKMENPPPPPPPKVIDGWPPKGVNCALKLEVIQHSSGATIIRKIFLNDRLTVESFGVGDGGYCNGMKVLNAIQKYAADFCDTAMGLDDVDCATIRIDKKRKKSSL